jgi:tetratricopeptide (TPR) repeat protein
VRHYDLVVRARPDDAEVRLRRATALINLGRRQAARQDLLHAAGCAEERPALLLRIAEALEFLGEHKQAHRLRGLATSQGGRSTTVARLQAEARQAMDVGRLDQAAEQLTRVLELDPSLIQARLDLASILGHQGRLDEALEQLAVVIERRPTSAAARHRQVIALVLLGRHADARQALSAGLQALPADAAMAEALARLLAASPDDAVRDGRAALRTAETLRARAGADTPADPALAETLAMAQAEAGDPDQAAATQAEAIRAAAALGLDDPAGRRQARLECYRRGDPWRIASPAELLDEALLRDRAAHRRGSPPG